MNGWIALLRFISLFVFVGAAGSGIWGAAVVLRSHRRWFAKLWAILLATSLSVVLWAALAFHLISLHAGY
jgi:hypothetical protein